MGVDSVGGVLATVTVLLETRVPKSLPSDGLTVAYHSWPFAVSLDGTDIPTTAPCGNA